MFLIPRYYIGKQLMNVPDAGFNVYLVRTIQFRELYRKRKTKSSHSKEKVTQVSNF